MWKWLNFCGSGSTLKKLEARANSEATNFIRSRSKNYSTASTSLDKTVVLFTQTFVEGPSLAPTIFPASLKIIILEWVPPLKIITTDYFNILMISLVT